MADDSPPKAQKTKTQVREDRLKAALKANMGRRKAQSRARGDKKDNDPKGANEESS